jgi:hypothetical protein
MQHSPVRSIIIWSWKDHLASGLIEVTYPSLLPRLILINIVSPVAFAKAFNLATPINLLTHYAKGTPSFDFFKLRLLIGLLIQVYFTMLIQYFSNFPLQYFSLLLNLLYLALEDGSPLFRQVFSHRTFCLV